MLEIKFRVFDKENSEMLIPTNFISYCPITENWAVKTTTKQNKDGKWERYFEEIYGLQLQVMQYTGLKDKNDEEIYAGDILEDNNYPEDGISRSTVIWNAEHGRWEAESWGVLGDEFDGYEVVGNTYENPELLK